MSKITHFLTQIKKYNQMLSKLEMGNYLYNSP